MRFWLAAMATVFLGSGAASAQVPDGYPADYAAVLEGAKKAGKVVVYATTDAAQAAPLIQGFEKKFPGVRVEYTDLNSTELYNRFIAEAAAGSGTADVLWSSAMDLQVKLASDGNAATYRSPEAAKLPAWAVWHDQAYGTTAEPLAFVYNKRLVPEGDVPRSHAAFLQLLTDKADTYRGKVTGYDPERSGVGFVQFTQDAAVWPQAWDLFTAFGKTGAKLYTSVGAMLERVGSGEHLIAYDIFGSYALARAKRDPSIAWVLPEDYTLVTSRVAFLSSKARSPEAGKLFLDYVLSHDGQDIIANQAELYSIRDDVTGEATLGKLNEQLGERAKPVAIDEGLLANLNQMKRLTFIRKWQSTMKGG